MARRITNITGTLSKARTCKVQAEPGQEDLYRVISPSGETYYCDVRDLTCTCPRQEWITDQNGYVNLCSHVQAALIFHFLHEGYWLVGRAEDADVGHLKRRIVTPVLDGYDHGDGVKFTARLIDEDLAARHLARMGEGPTPDQAEAIAALEYEFGIC